MANNIGYTDKPYISAVNFLDEREIAPQIIDIYNDAAWTQFAWETGRREMSMMPWYDSFYTDKRYTTISLTGATITNSGTNTITIVFNSANSGITIVGHILYFPDGNFGRVQTRSSSGGIDTITVKAVVTGGTLTASVGDNLSIVGNAQEEGSSAPDPQRWNLSSVRNLIQVFRTSATITDIQGMAYRTVKVNGDPHVIPQDFIDSLQKLMGQIASYCWAGQISGTLFSDASPDLTGANGRGVQTTRGINEYINLFGLTPGVASPGTITQYDLQALCDQLTSRRAPDDYMLIGGNSPVTVMDNWLKNLGSSGAQSVRIMDQEGKDTNFMATGFSYGGYNFKMRREKLLSNPDIFNFVQTGTTKSAIATSLYVLPEGKCTIYGGTDGNSGSSVDYWRYRYMQAAPQMGKGNNTINTTSNGMIMEAMTGLYAPTPTSQNAVLEVTFTANVGMEVFSSQKFARWGVQ